MSAVRRALVGVTVAALTMFGSMSFLATAAQASPTSTHATAAVRALPDKPKPCKPKKYPPKKCKPKVAVAPPQVPQGGTITVTGSGFQPGELVEITIDGVLVDTVRADKNGEVHVKVPIPGGTSLGAHTVTLTGQDSGGAASAQVQVLPLQVKGEKVTRGSGLPFTGLWAIRMTGVGVAMVVAGCLAAVTFRRRRHLPSA